MMDRVWGRGADVGRLVGRGQVVAPWPPGGRLVRRNHVRGRPHLASRRPALVAGVERRLLGRYNLWREGRAVADPVAVPEPVLEQIFPKKYKSEYSGFGGKYSNPNIRYNTALNCPYSHSDSGRQKPNSEQH